MIDRQEKLWLIRQQIAKAIAEVDHGDTPQSCLALANALGAMLSFCEALNATQEAFNTRMLQPRVEDKETRAAFDDLRTESTKIKRR